MPAHFARLRIAGFKSFADPVTLEILPGLTGIVGPNGCGKSNVVDALRWVMGEASAKSMRGGEMDDVIFAGTLSRPPRNIGEVTISLADTEGRAPPPFQHEHELQISRKIERETGSVYRVNGRETRARDVATLFADLASGARNSAMISQGRVAALVGARPDERRAILEEAAGISGLHARRHEAELKLRATEQNLARADDLRVQQESRLTDLRKQARQASRYRNLSGAIREAETEYLAIELARAIVQREAARAALDRARSAAAAAQVARDAAHAEERDRADRLPALRAAESDARTALERALIEFEQIEANIARTRAARTEAEARLAALIRDHEHGERTRTDAGAAIASLVATRSRLQAEHAAAPALHDRAREAAEQAATALHEADSRLQRATEAAAHHAAACQMAQTQLQRAREKAADAVRRAEQSGAALARAVAEQIVPERLTRAESERAQAEAASRIAEANLTTADRKVRDAESARIAAAEDAAAARTAALAAEATLARLAAETGALEALLAQKFGRDPDPILDRIVVPAGLETALGAALPHELAASTSPHALRFWRTLSPITASPTLTPLAALVDAPDALQRILRAILLLPEHGDGDALQAQLEPGETLVGRDGALWRWDGYVTRAGAPSEAAVRLAQRNRLAVLQVDRALATAEAARWKATRTETDLAERTTRDAEDRARRERKEAESAVEGARAIVRTRGETAARLSADAERFAARAATAVELHARLDAERGEANAALAQARADLESLGDADAVRGELEAARSALAEARRSESATRLALQRLNDEAERRDHRRTTIDREIADWGERDRDATARMIDLAARLDEARIALAGIASDADAAQAGEHGRSHRDEAQARHRTRAAELADAERRATAASTRARAADQHLADAREALVGIDATLREADHAWGSIAERVLARLGTDPRLPATPDATPEAAERARKRFERLTRERDETGPVNLRGDLEVTEVETRLAAIEQDRTEITTAIAKLRGSIGHLNREGRERLAASFTAIDRHFQSLFTRMFGGGRAHLALTGSDDPLLAGLEIFAEPPGKKLATLSLLSGGEQALTALSLIFAVFRCNPAPISVLDEVDAPLDDANVDRFCTLLDDMTRETGTRFLVVTHHHLTMARMDRLYGVTMQERGISRVLSVDLGTAAALVDQSAPLAAE